MGLIAVLAALMAFSRIYIAAHYPQDVLGGLLLGIAVTGLGYLAARRLLVWLLDRTQRTPLRPLLTATPATSAQL
ncbi:phosphatase PAP2 family protein [Nocardia sp. NPDC051030]|uniref:phosphatase PAP2 family protein n=1 Tax=Nocardia sp. NPDC051030 TaxID=3155162 RepID=UPI0034133E13